MNREILSRICRLEVAASTAKGARPWHRIIAGSCEEAEAKHAALIEAGEASNDDNATYRIIAGVPRSTERAPQ